MVNNQYFSFFKSLVIGLIIITCFDITFGYLVDSVLKSTKSGNYQKLQEGLNESKYNRIILGNSRAERQFIPSVLDYENKWSSFNLGYGGRDLQFVQALEKCLLNKGNIDHIILEFQYANLRDPVKEDRMSFLNPFYFTYPDFQGYLNREEEARKIFFYSSFYRYNSSLWDVFSPLIIQDNQMELGYRPLFGKMKQLRSKKPGFDSKEMNKRKMKILQSFVVLAKSKNVQLSIVLSPQLYPHNKNKFLKEKAFIQQFLDADVRLFDFSQDERFLEQLELFNDERHLNHEGAIRFNEILRDALAD